jgi:hypothetical protein
MKAPEKLKISSKLLSYLGAQGLFIQHFAAATKLQETTSATAWSTANLQPGPSQFEGGARIEGTWSAKCAATTDERRFGDHGMHNDVGGALILPTRTFPVGPAVIDRARKWVSAVAFLALSLFSR